MLVCSYIYNYILWYTHANVICSCKWDNNVSDLCFHLKQYPFIPGKIDFIPIFFFRWFIFLFHHWKFKRTIWNCFSYRFSIIIIIFRCEFFFRSFELMMDRNKSWIHFITDSRNFFKNKRKWQFFFTFSLKYLCLMHISFRISDFLFIFFFASSTATTPSKIPLFLWLFGFVYSKSYSQLLSIFILTFSSSVQCPILEGKNIYHNGIF